MNFELIVISLKVLEKYDIANKSPIHSIVITNDNKLLIAGLANGKIVIFAFKKPL